MVTWIIFGAILVAAFFATRYSLRKAKNGECVGCSGCKGGHSCHCGDLPASHHKG